MQDEFDEAGLPIAIIGLNGIDKDTKTDFLEERDLPWLLDTDEQDVWNQWHIQYRDLLILDAENQPLEVYNLTNYNLSTDAYDTVKNSLIDLAEAL